jgi:hypothetical protein
VDRHQNGNSDPDRHTTKPVHNMRENHEVKGLVDTVTYPEIISKLSK